MSYKFSKIEQSFYPIDIEYPNMPTDLVDVTDSEYQSAIARLPGETLDYQNGALVIVPAPSPTPAQLATELKSSAQSALMDTDMVALRCWKASIPFPADWQTYTTELRAIANGTDTTSIALPTKPIYPAGT